jgi:Molybdopterin cofactor-binding domain
MLTQSLVVELTGLPNDAIKIHNHLIGGGFGRRLEADCTVLAVKIAKHVDGPVRVIWSREEDIQHDMYRPYYFDRLSAGLDAAGKPVAWTHRIAGSSIAARYIPYWFKDGSEKGGAWTGDRPLARRADHENPRAKQTLIVDLALFISLRGKPQILPQGRPSWNSRRLCLPLLATKATTATAFEPKSSIARRLSGAVVPGCGRGRFQRRSSALVPRTLRQRGRPARWKPGCRSWHPRRFAVRGSSVAQAAQVVQHRQAVSRGERPNWPGLISE